MNVFRTENVAYTILLIILFAIASLASWRIIRALNELAPGDISPQISAAIWALTLGFMFIAGGFGLWGINMSAAAEGRRRVGRFVDEMDYIRDAAMTVDGRGRITGGNPAAHEIGQFGKDESPGMAEAFPCLRNDDVALLSNPSEPVEIERTLRNDRGQRILRFRAQATQGLALVLISDVTQMNASRLRNRQMARLQLLEHIAKGVAHDVNTLLCGISGQASLLTRIPPDSAEGAAALGAIDDAARRGSLLTGRLLGLVRPQQTGPVSIDVHEPVESAALLLRDSLSRGWVVDVLHSAIPPSSFTSFQLEQVVLNLGLLVADAQRMPGTLSIEVQAAGREPAASGADYAGAIVVRAKGEGDSSAVAPDLTSVELIRPGMIQSVLESVVGNCGGRIESLRGPGPMPGYVLWLPRAEPASLKEDRTELPQELAAYVSSWRVLLASSRSRLPLQKRLADIGTRVDAVDNVVSALAQVEKSQSYDGAVFDVSLLRHEAAGLLRALVKLSPRTGFVACGEPHAELVSLSSDVIFVPEWSVPDRIIIAMMEARTLALRRSQG